MTKVRRSNGEGTVYRRANGLWAAQVYVNESDGRRVRRSISGRSRREVENKMTELRQRSDAGRVIAPADLTLGAYLDEWLAQIVAVRVRPNTLAAYRYNAERYLIPDLGGQRLAALSARGLRLYFEGLRARGVGARTVKYVHTTLRAALEDAVREEVVERNPAALVRVLGPPRQERVPLTVDEVRVLLRWARHHRLYSMLIVFALLGMRRSEVLGLRWDEVDLDQGLIRVKRGLHRVNGQLTLLPTKTARSRRTIPLPKVVVDALSEHRARQEAERTALAERWPESGFVFTTPIGTAIDPRNCTRLVQRACREAGVRAVRLHDFRHGCVSVLLGLGVPPRTAMEIAGHSTIEMTMNVYGHVTLDDKREALDLLGSLFEEEK